MSSLRNAYDRVSLSEAGFILRNLTTNGLIGGDPNGNVDGSATPIKLFTAPPADARYVLREMTISVGDTGAIEINDYGSISGPLANGVQFYIKKRGVEILLGLPLKTNGGLVDLGPFRDRITYTSNKVTAYEFAINAYADRGIELSGNDGDEFGVIIQDNLSTLLTHTFSVKGRDLRRFV